jgi:hypothetical protein
MAPFTQSRKFHPRVETLEARDVPSASPTAPHIPLHHHGHHGTEHHHATKSGADVILDRTTPSSSKLRGTYGSGSLNANGDGVFFFALTYTGTLTASTAHQAWINGFHKVEAGDISLQNPNVDINAGTSARQHFLIGYQDPSSDQGGWIGADANPDGTLHYFVGRPSLSASDNEHSTDVTKTFSDNGTTFQMEVTAVSAGHVRGVFSQPM